MDQEILLAVFLDLASRSIGFDQAEWEVTAVWLQPGATGAEEVHVRIEKRSDFQLRCPVCGGRAGACDTRERTWRHLDVWGLRTVVHCRVPRAECEDCGVHTVNVPWVTRKNTEPLARPMEAQVIRGAQRSTTKAVAELLGESDTRLWGVITRAVEQAREAADHSGVHKVGLDETSKAKGQDYISVMMDLEGKRVVGVADGKDNSVVGKLCDQPGAHGGDRRAITDVTRDMSGPFAKGVRENMPQASQTIDKFHVMQLFSKAIDKAGNEGRKESEEKYEQPEGTKYVWPRRAGHLTERQARIRAELDPKRSHLRTARACQMAEGMHDACQRETKEEAEGALRKLHSWMTRSNVPQMKTVAKTIKENWDDILNWWDSRVTNAILEGTNSLIQSIKRASRGFRNVAYFEAMIFLRHGKLEFEALRG